MLIEFIGLPGSGKTYYQDYLISKKYNFLTRNDILERRLYYRDIVEFIYNNFSFVILLFISFLCNINWNIKKNYTLLLGIKDIMKIYIIKKKLHDKDILLDEGIHQRLLSILFYRKSNLNMKLLNLLLVVMGKEFIPSKLIILDVSIDQSIENATKRKDGLPFRFKYFSEKDLLDRYNQFNRGIDLIEKKTGDYSQYIHRIKDPNLLIDIIRVEIEN
ncbi:hypothetical protein CL656_04480 [bacterium]|nr:hypothetical protein [bacterium]